MNDEELTAAFQRLFDKLAEPITTALLEHDAKLIAHRYLLEEALANGFLNDAKGFEAFKAHALDPQRSPDTKAGPMPQEIETELKVRVATNMQRILQSVGNRLDRP